MRTFTLIFAFAFLPIFAFSQDLEGIDEIAPYSEGLAAVRKGKQWGFIDKSGALVIDFRSDLHWMADADPSRTDIKSIRYPMFVEGRCIVKAMEDEIPIYGFMDKKGEVVIEPQFLNVSNFENGYTTGVVFEKVLRGKNEFNLNIFEFKFHDVLMDSSGKIEEFFARRQNILMNKRRYELPPIQAKMLSANLAAVWTEDKRWSLREVKLPGSN